MVWVKTLQQNIHKLQLIQNFVAQIMTVTDSRLGADYLTFEGGGGGEFEKKNFRQAFIVKEKRWADYLTIMNIWLLRGGGCGRFQKKIPAKPLQ